MSSFNRNMRFMRLKMGLSQNGMAEDLGEKRGKLAAYEIKAQAKPDFHKKIVVKYDIDLGRFLTVDMDNDNYSTFFSTNDQSNQVSEPRGDYFKKSDIFDLLAKIKNCNDREERSMLIDSVISIYGKTLEENGGLKSEITQLQRDLLEVVRKQ